MASDGRPGVSVVMTVRNEAAGIAQLLDALFQGSVTPDEVIVADGGSTDETVAIVSRYHDQRVRLIEGAGDRSSGRNAAIEAASNDRIAVIDGGCVPRADWLEHMTAAFESGADWIGGFYQAVGPTPLSTAIGLTMVYVEEEAQRHFVPSARSLGFTKQTWAEVGGFPEGVQFAEDTLFAERLFKTGRRPRFTPKAVVEWRPPGSLAEQSRTMYRWGHGDGVQGLRRRHYLRLLMLALGQLSLIVVVAVIESRLVPLALIPTVIWVARGTRDKYRHMDSSLRWLLIPSATLNGAISSLAGFLVGSLERKRVAG